MANRHRGEIEAVLDGKSGERCALARGVSMNVIRSWPSDRQQLACVRSVVARQGAHLILITDHFPERRFRMQILSWLITGGFAKGYRTQILGVTTALSAVALWAVGDMSIADLVAKLPIALGGLGLAALGAKVDDQADKVNRAKPAKAK